MSDGLTGESEPSVTFSFLQSWVEPESVALPLAGLGTELDDKAGKKAASRGYRRLSPVELSSARLANM